jgi:hypothetical protein
MTPLRSYIDYLEDIRQAAEKAVLFMGGMSLAGIFGRREDHLRRNPRAGSDWRSNQARSTGNSRAIPRCRLALYGWYPRQADSRLSDGQHRSGVENSYRGFAAAAASLIANSG